MRPAESAEGHKANVQTSQVMASPRLEYQAT
jgi:hypothetical protein